MALAKELSWSQVRALAERSAVALLPVGSTEAHGPHLPLSVDVLIAEEVCRRAAALLESKGQLGLIFPAVPYGLTDFAAGFSGTVSVGADATRAYLSDVLVGIASHGFARVAVVNHHLEPAHFAVVHAAALDASARCAAKICVPDHRKRPTSPLLGVEFTHGGSHAGLYETSLMLAVAPHLVDQRAAAALPELAVDLPARIKAGARRFEELGGAQAYFGAPAMATATEGHRLFDVLAAAVVDALA